MDPMHALQAKVRYERIDSVHFLSNRIQQDALTTSEDMERDARKTSSGPHIKESAALGLQTFAQQQGIKDMQYHCVVNINDAREVDIGVDLLHVQEVLDA